MNNDLPEKQATSSEILFYQTENGISRIEVRLENETVWLTQKGLAELYQTTTQNITMHVRSIYKEQELAENATCKKHLQVRQEGNRQIERKLKFYNLDMILAIGYRVRSHRGTQFRQWATERLREYLVKGFVMDDERLKEGKSIGADYFDELLERIRDIRASEKRFYQKIRDIYKLSIDYDPKAETTQEFFQIVQNKLHWAIAGQTAAEIIAERADASKPNMGLTSWKGAKVRRADATIAKNYLNEKEIRQLNRIVTMYLDYAEEQAERQTPIYMKAWKEKLDGFLKFNQRDILKHPGKVSTEIAHQLALDEYEKFNRHRLAEEAETTDDDFDHVAKQLEQGKKKRTKGKKKDRSPSDE